MATTQKSTLRKNLPGHLHWLLDNGQRLETSEGKTVKVLEFEHRQDNEVLSAWASHVRSHYCLDGEIDALARGTGLSRAEYLKSMKFPDSHQAPGPSIRSGDFGEILVADYLQFLEGYVVPRTKYSDKAIRNESVKGTDIIGFKVFDSGKESLKDVLAVYEAKAQFSGTVPENRLQDAVNDSAKDVVRKAESLNALKQRWLREGKTENCPLVERFQNKADHPYTEISGAAALFSSACYSPDISTKTDTSMHPNRENLMLLVIRGSEMMPLVHELYERAANEA